MNLLWDFTELGGRSVEERVTIVGNELDQHEQYQRQRNGKRIKFDIPSLSCEWIFNIKSCKEKM